MIRIMLLDHLNTNSLDDAPRPGLKIRHLDAAAPSVAKVVFLAAALAGRAEERTALGHGFHAHTTGPLDDEVGGSFEVDLGGVAGEGAAGAGAGVGAGDGAGAACSAGGFASTAAAAGGEGAELACEEGAEGEDVCCHETKVLLETVGVSVSWKEGEVVEEGGLTWT